MGYTDDHQQTTANKNKTRAIILGNFFSFKIQISTGCASENGKILSSIFKKLQNPQFLEFPPENFFGNWPRPLLHNEPTTDALAFKVILK